MILQLEELFFVELRQRGRRNIEAQMNRRRDFINVLPAGALRTHRTDVDLCIRNRHVRQDVQHQGQGKLGSQKVKVVKVGSESLYRVTDYERDSAPTFPNAHVR